MGEYKAVLLAVASLAVCVVGIQITDLRVPSAVRNGSSSALLDCEYTLKPDELNLSAGLVLKWYFNDSPVPVYQWIIGKKPQDLGILQGRLDMGYRASDNNYTMHRALYIKNPTTELSGDYRCLVSSFTDEDFMNKKMIVYVPERKFVLKSAHLQDLEAVNVTCRAHGLFPEPKMALFRDPDAKTKTGLMDEVLVITTRNSQGSYDIMATKVLEDENLKTPTVFECELKIPGTNYAIRKSTVYYPGVAGSPSDSGSRLKTPLWWSLVSIIPLLLCSSRY